MPKVVINQKSGGFGLSHNATLLYANLKHFNIQAYYISSDKKDLYEIYKKEMGENIDYSLIIYCILPRGESFPQYVDNKFIVDNEFNINNFGFLGELNGVEKLKDFRSDPCLVAVVEELEELSFNEYSSLKVVDVPDDVIWEIWVFDSGDEIVKEVSREWR